MLNAVYYITMRNTYETGNRKKKILTFFNNARAYLMQYLYIAEKY